MGVDMFMRALFKLVFNTFTYGVMERVLFGETDVDPFGMAVTSFVVRYGERRYHDSAKQCPTEQAEMYRWCAPRIVRRTWLVPYLPTTLLMEESWMFDLKNFDWSHVDAA